MLIGAIAFWAAALASAFWCGTATAHGSLHLALATCVAAVLTGVVALVLFGASFFDCGPKHAEDL